MSKYNSRRKKQREKKRYLTAAELEGLAISWLKIYGPIQGVGKRTIRERLRKWRVEHIASESLDLLSARINGQFNELQ